MEGLLETYHVMGVKPKLHLQSILQGATPAHIDPCRVAIYYVCEMYISAYHLYSFYRI